MQKLCEVCKRPYPDTEKACPHCAASKARPGSDADIDLGPALAAAGTGDSSAVVVELAEEDEAAPAAPRAAVPPGSEADIDLGPAAGAGGPGDSGVAVVELAEEEAAPAGSPSDSVVDLGKALAQQSGQAPAAEPSPSDASMEAWAALAEESPAAGAGEVRLDSPSDADLLRHAREEAPAAPPPEKPAPAQPAASEEVPLAESGGPPSGVSNVAWVALVEEADEPGAAESVVQFDSPSDADILKHAGAPAPAAADETSSVNLGGAPEPAAGGPASDLNLVHEALEPGLSEVNAGASPSDSGMLVELVDEEEQPAAGSAADLVEGLTGAGGPAGAAEGERPSGRDLIAEAVESGVDLAHAAEPAKAEEEPAIDLGHVTPTEDSSAVDLGASTPEVSSEEMAKAAAELRDLDLARLHEEPAAADSAVNLGAAGERAAGESGVEAVAAEAEEAAGAEAEAEHAAAAAALLGGAGEEEAAGERAGAAAEEDRFAGLGEEEAAEEPEAEAEAEAEAEEEAEAEAEAEEEAEAEAEEEEVAAGPKEKAVPAKRGGVGCLALGGVAGLFVGAAAVLALLVALPGVAGSILGPLGVKLQDKEPPRGPDLSAKQPTLQDARDHLRRGDLDRAWPTLESAGDQPETLAARGEARWLRYLQQHPVPKADDEEVKKAAEDLQKAGETDPDALFWLGHLQERTGNLAAAKATYEKGLKQFQNDVPQKRRFQAALDRLESRAAVPAAGNLARDDARLLLVLLVTGLQPPGQPRDGQPKDGQPVPPGQPQPGQPQPGDAGQEEAGFEFWSAVKMAGKGDYANAIKELDKARQLHDKLRFTRLRKAQNPLSDPTEDIFLKSCDELKAYWQIRERLSRGKYLDFAQNRDPVKAIDAALAEATAMKAAQARLQARTPEEAGKALDQLIQGKKDADDKVVKLTDDLKKAEKDIADAKKATDTALEMVKDRDKKLQAANDLLKAADARLKAIADNLGVKQADVVKGVQQLGDACNKANASLDAVARKLKADKYLDADADRSKVPEGVDRALMVAREKDPAGRIAAAEREAQRARAVATQRWTPQQMLDVWLPVVQTQPAGVNTKRSLQDAARVLADKDAPREAKAKAQAVRGFVLRKEGKHAEARKALEEALKDDKAPVGWRADARRTLDALSDPAAWYLPTAEGYYASGHNAEALKVLDEALQVFPKDNARLLALRSLVRLAQASDKARGNPTADDPAVKAALQDAQAAIDGGAKPEGLYAAGRIAEEVGDLAGARKAYEAALAAHPEADLSGNRYRVALARVLLKQERAKAGEGRVGRLPAGGAARLLAALKDGDPADSLAALALLVTLAVPPDGLPTPEQQKANELANEVLKSRPAPGDFLLRAQAHALQGEWTKALKVYVEGLRPHLRRDYADGLAEIINNHPAFKRPDSRNVPNPLLAEQHWGAGLRAYYARRWADAEREFGEAIANDSQDARYFYFLGLSRLQQGRRADAIADFEEGYRLEELGKPSRTAVNASLERVQGPMRRTLDRYRETSK